MKVVFCAAALILIANGAMTKSTWAQSVEVSPAAHEGNATKADVEQVLHNRGYEEIIDIGRHDGKWKGRAVKAGYVYDVVLDPATGKIVSSNRDYQYDRGGTTEPRLRD